LVQFTKIRLSSFKSFVEPVELNIDTGLTGIVGPNGCGKSNVLEALRWVMGETAPKKLRGGEMDDIIFGGTADRPARNIAEVMVHLDNGDRAAPAAFNDHDEIEIVRRVERGHGSTYRINGREVRARDVQLIFADAATGARSTALVSQGRIGALINAKPIDRRGLLEEAAGITGLHSRRHEAELRLRAAENNLERLDDVLAAFETQLQNLKRQARQAKRYRNISDHIRKAESILQHLRWQAAAARLDEARAQVREVEAQLTAQAERVGEATRAQAESAGGLPALRQAEAEAAAEVQRLTVAREQLDAEEQRITESRRECETRLQQIAADREREQTLVADAEAMLRRLDEERERLTAARAGEEGAQAEAAARVEAAVHEAEALETEAMRRAERIAATEARLADMVRRSAETEQRRARLQQRTEEVAAECDRLAAEAAGWPQLEVVEAEVMAAQGRLKAARGAAEGAEQARTAAQKDDAEARTAFQDCEAELSKLSAEEEALAALLELDGSGDRPPLLDEIGLEPGYEAAFAAALGDDLLASADAAAAVHWQALPPLEAPPALPGGAEPLARFAKAPAVLDRRLSQIGVVADDEAGRRAWPELAVGQRLVSRDGGLWRWDGFTVAAGAPTAARTRLAQRRRLEELGHRRAAAEQAAAAAGRRAEQARADAAEAEARERRTRDDADRAFSELAEARDALAELADKRSQNRSLLTALFETTERLKADLAEADRDLAALKGGDGELVDPEADKATHEQLRHDLAERRGALMELQRQSEALGREAEARRQRLAAMDAEQESWRGRAAGGASQLAQLEERQRAAEAELERLAQRPREIADQRSVLMDGMETAEAGRRTAADRLAKAEARLADCDKRLKAAEAALADLREQRGLGEGAVMQAQQAADGVAERIAETLHCRPENALEAGGVKEGEALPELAAVETRLERLLKERDNMGPVNLRAEQEAGELEAQIESLGSERNDLLAAIAKFRHAIAELNREGRERLLASFEEVNGHFEALFARLFGGGRAHLKLTESEDPLEAGLEIMASPPGKRLQSLSLLSGGEQTLTALALQFAVFLTNPAPICVLDEVDAALDDANVDRFCGLLEEIAHSSATRFLVITHHSMSMARMDRLFGVTMPERGVSQLVSVDLQDAERLRETA